MGQVSKKGPNKTFKLGKRGQINCPDCSQLAYMIKLPGNLPFTQEKLKTATSSSPTQSTQKSSETRYCRMCGQKLGGGTKFCDYCGSEQ